MFRINLFDESQTRLADFGYMPQCKSKNPRGLNARMNSLPQELVLTFKSRLFGKTFSPRKINKQEVTRVVRFVTGEKN